jgi:DNA-binding SARP family transcriptional activator/tetratricopeptide (TPR) repeat protein
MGPEMRIGLLGPLVVRDGEQPPVVRAGKQRVVLAALALRARQVVSFGELASVVWDESPPPGARVTLRNYVWRLRLLLAPAGGQILTRDPGYLLDADGSQVDALEFGALCREGGQAARAGDWPRAAEVLGRALALWRGTPLADVPSRTLRQEWVPSLQRQRLRALSWRLEALLHLGAHGEVLGELEQLAGAHPLDEHLHALRMLALYRSGRVGDALAAYQQARRALVGELGVEPGEELRRLHQQVLARDPALMAPCPAPEAGLVTPAPAAPAPAAPAARAAVSPQQAAAPVPRQLPAAVTHFAGRSDELRLLACLAERASGGGPGGAVAIAAVAGTAGVGKTALAVHFGHQVADRFPDGQLYADLRGFGPATEPVPPAQAIRGFLVALGVAPQGIPADADAQAGLYRSLLAGKRMLVVLDNARDAAQVRPLLPGSAGCLVVVTSRRQLTGLAAAEDARLLALGLLTDGEARALLTGRLGAGRVAAEPAAVSELIGLCARLPLALAIAAARAAARPAHPLAALAAELRDSSRLDALDTGEPIDNVRAVFSWSYDQLSRPAAGMFRCLGLHPGPDISVPAAASLVAADPAQARQLLAELAHSSLIGEPLPGRYGFHDLLRAYAAEQASAASSGTGPRAALQSVLDHYLHTAHAAALLLEPSREPLSLGPPRPGVRPERLDGHQQALAWFEAEHHVLLSAVTLAPAHGFDRHAWQLPWTMTDFLDRRGYWHDWAAVQRTALAAATRLGDIAGQAAAHRLLAQSYARVGNYDQARAHLTDCLSLCERVSDSAGQARVLQTLCWVADRQGRAADALGHAEQALALFRAIGDRPSEAVALNNVGYCHILLGSPQHARAFCQQALDLHRDLGNRYGQAVTWDSLGYAEYHLGRFTDAVRCYQQAVSLFREHADRFNEATSLTHLGDTHDAAGQPEQAQDSWALALAILDDLHHPDAGKLRAKFLAPA